MKQLLEAGVHFGHQTKRWNPKMRRFIFGERSGIYIIDLEQTQSRLAQAQQFARELTAKGGLLLFIATKKQAQMVVREEAKRCGMPYIVNRWLGGLLTNFQTIRKSAARLQHIRDLRDSGTLATLSKKESARLGKEMARLEWNLEGIADLAHLPQALFVIDTKREEIAVHEANRLGIPVVAVCDTNSDPDRITVPIPGNDDAIRAVRLIASMIADACLEGRREFAESQPPGVVLLPQVEEAAPEAAAAAEGPVPPDASAATAAETLPPEVAVVEEEVLKAKPRSGKRIVKPTPADEKRPE
ncbi:MAG: 30S ribosomal protein S2 [Candidatus Omnitrophica bacterium]|nr:30S ribosomal protein S2 [Candidatus Omnitrophota bacterium]